MTQRIVSPRTPSEHHGPDARGREKTHDRSEGGALLRPDACPVAALAREHVALCAAYAANEERSSRLKEHSAERLGLDRANDLIQDRQNSIEDIAAHTRARSLEGAMFQVMVAWTDAQTLAAAAAVGIKDAEARRYERRIGGLLYGVVGALEEASDTPAADLGAGFFMSGLHDPHAVLDAARTARREAPHA